VIAYVALCSAHRRVLHIHVLFAIVATIILVFVARDISNLYPSHLDDHRYVSHITDVVFDILPVMSVFSVAMVVSEHDHPAIMGLVATSGRTRTAMSVLSVQLIMTVNVHVMMICGAWVAMQGVRLGVGIPFPFVTAMTVIFDALLIQLLMMVTTTKESKGILWVWLLAVMTRHLGLYTLPESLWPVFPLSGIKDVDPSFDVLYRAVHLVFLACLHVIRHAHRPIR
jgi:hypothetical protein